MAREPSNREILADDAGNIRAEVADFLMQPAQPRQRPQLRPPLRQGHQQVRRERSNGWLFFFIILSVFFFITTISKGHHSENKITDRQERAQTIGESSMTGPIVIDSNETNDRKPEIQGHFVQVEKREEHAVDSLPVENGGVTNSGLEKPMSSQYDQDKVVPQMLDSEIKLGSNPYDCIPSVRQMPEQSSKRTFNKNLETVESTRTPRNSTGDSVGKKQNYSSHSGIIIF
jgi:hypothetical protein